jgi:hypothetical protein
MLAAGGQTALINEPFNRSHQTGMMRAPVRSLYTYVCNQNEAEYLGPMQETLAYRYHYWAQLTGHPVKDLPRAARDAIGFLRGRLARRRPLLKDPFALFSVPWFAEQLECQVVILVRHPLAFASSLKRLDWSFDFGDLLGQPLLMAGWLSSFRPEMERMQRQPGDVISQANLLWRMIYGTVARYRLTLPGVTVVRHEDLSLDPVRRARPDVLPVGRASHRSLDHGEQSYRAVCGRPACRSAEQSGQSRELETPIEPSGDRARFGGHAGHCRVLLWGRPTRSAR